MTPSPSEDLCACCGAPLPHGMVFCNARCYWAWAEDVERYLDACKLTSEPPGLAAREAAAEQDRLRRYPV